MCYNQFNKTDFRGDVICGLYSHYCLNICGAYIYTGKGRHRRSKLKSCNSHQNSRRSYYGMGNGFPYKCAKRYTGNKQKSWLFLILSGLAAGASWLCYYKALQIGEASKAVPIDKLSVVITLILAFVFLHEKFTIKSLIGCVLIGAGTLVMVLK